MFSARSEPDAQLRRIGRSTLWAYAIIVVLAAVSGGGLRAVLGAIAGGGLVFVSFRAIRGGVDALVGAHVHGQGPSASPSTVWRLVKFVTRFAILGTIAYVMMVRLRAQPVWMLLGASSLVAAAALEAVRAPRAPH
jgi:hypothetical protein